jgi:hypothetical protein
MTGEMGAVRPSIFQAQLKLLATRTPGGGDFIDRLYATFMEVPPQCCPYPAAGIHRYPDRPSLPAVDARSRMILQRVRPTHFHHPQVLMKIPALLAACVTFASCATPIPQTSSAPALLENTSPFVLTIDDRVKAADRATLTEIVNATVQVITSDRFAERLAAIEQQQLWLSPGEDTLPPREVLEIYLGRHPSMRSVPTLVSVTKKWFSGAPITGLSASPPVRGTIRLSTAELKRWRKGTPQGRSCAVNTLAHELTHTISRSADRGVYLFTDRGRDAATQQGQPLVSYVVGSVAQCTMLEAHNALGGDFAACVRRWGTNLFYSGGCS